MPSSPPTAPILTPSDESIRAAQIQLVCGNGGNSVIPTVLLAALLFVTLSHPTNATPLAVWCCLIAVSALHGWWFAARCIANPPRADAVQLTVWRMTGLHTIDGALWGALPWVALDASSLTGVVLIMAVLTGVAANSMSLLSPLLVVYAGFLTAEFVVCAAKLFAIGDPSFQSLGYAAVLFALTMVGQSLNLWRSARATIRLRFENSALLSQLRTETRSATQAKLDAEQANAAKSKFLAAASHDLRQPIHAQGLFLDVLGESSLTQQQTEVLERAKSASLATSDMLNTLLDFSRIEAGVVKPNWSEFELSALLRRIENDLAPVARAKHISYRTRPTTQWLRADQHLLELILRNLASNAVRYTDKGGVLLACRVRDGVACIEVWDTGIGIPADKQGDVFREFHQLGNSERDRRKGLGLGLAIARGMANSMGLSLTLKSTLGRGSVFRLTTPLASAARASGHVINAAPERKQSLDGMRVLVVDDDEAIRIGMVELLRQWGCACASAADLLEAVAAAITAAPDLVISDYRLRDHVTGTQVIAAVRQAIGAHTPALLVTGDTAPERLREALGSGLTLLHKPVSPVALREAITQLRSQMRPT